MNLIHIIPFIEFDTSMECKPTLDELLAEISKQEEIIDGYIRDAEEQGNLDPSFEEYLNQAKIDLQNKREEIFKQHLEVKAVNSFPDVIEVKTPIIKSRKVTQSKNLDQNNRYPFYSIQNVPLVKHVARCTSAGHDKQPGPEKIFKQSMCKSNSNSPSALRYEPKKEKEVLSTDINSEVFKPIHSNHSKRIPIIKVETNSETD